MNIELLYFEGCPSYQNVWNDLGEVLVELESEAWVRLVYVGTQEKADELGFAGSPSVHIGGEDLEGYKGPGVLACRIYEENDQKGWPSKALLKAALGR